MAEKGFGIKQLDIIGSTGTPLVESKDGLNIRVAGQGPGGIGHTVGIGTTGLTAWLETKANADPDNVTTLNCGIVTANKLYGTFEGTIGGDVASITLNANVEDVLSVSSNQLSADNPSGSNDKIIFWDESATKLTHLDIGTGLTLDDTTLTADGTTYTLPLTGTAGASGNAEWTLTPAGGGTPTVPANKVKLTAGTNVSISALDTTGPDCAFTIDVASGGGLALDASVTDVLDLTSGTLSADNPSGTDDKIIFWDESAGKLTHLTAGNGLTITDTTITATVTSGVTDVTVDYTGRTAPCSLPITVTTPTTGTKQINIPGNSNAFGAKYVQDAEPTGSSVCDGDVWYDTSEQTLDDVLPSGAIIMYNSTTAPTGWVLCDNSTAAQNAGAPDLRARFIVGTGDGSGAGNSNYSYGATGGAEWVTLTKSQMPSHDHDADASVSDPGHKHQLKGGVDDADSGNYISAGDKQDNLNSNAMNDATTGISVSIDVDNEGGGNSHENRPPYFALTFIMKL